MRKITTRFFKNESGATAIEYGLMASLIAIGIISASANIGKTVSNTLGSVSNNMTSTK